MPKHYTAHLKIVEVTEAITKQEHPCGRVLQPSREKQVYETMNIVTRGDTQGEVIGKLTAIMEADLNYKRE